MNITKEGKHNMLQAAMSVDVEEYFQVAAFDKKISVQQWGEYPSRIRFQMDTILQLFEDHNVKSTFFILGAVAEKHKSLVKSIHNLGHEVASHGTMHQKADRQSPVEFRDDIRRSKLMLEDIIGDRVDGYRAPSFSINTNNTWAFSEIRDAGFLYSSSTYPVKHDHYGTPDWPTSPFCPVDGLIEIPQSTIPMKGKAIPVGGGGYFRLMPYALSKWALQKHMKDNRHPYMFYFHPWEIDHEQPRIQGAGIRSSFRHYVNQSKMLPKLDKLCTVAEWKTIRDAFGINNQTHHTINKVPLCAE